jgi:hypothetical protein
VRDLRKIIKLMRKQRPRENLGYTSGSDERLKSRKTGEIRGGLSGGGL